MCKASDHQVQTFGLPRIRLACRERKHMRAFTVSVRRHTGQEQPKQEQPEWYLRRIEDGVTLQWGASTRLPPDCGSVRGRRVSWALCLRPFGSAATLPSWVTQRQCENQTRVTAWINRRIDLPYERHLLLACATQMLRLWLLCRLWRTVGQIRLHIACTPRRISAALFPSWWPQQLRITNAFTDRCAAPGFTISFQSFHIALPWRHFSPEMRWQRR
ncbi:hypothetical protein BDZ90DRAFT_86568 [Jaminaea rosea]|uniref:Uncharacterized protein n=1 Tax=Jaminaea rosea TaxID=1569628 RepID=A0A316UNW3_9BASI|nr:hypothetical protein BDZ90DRAFT_86568 [Jaminaea rosea]PWN24855.1 hypothetical protein BDZ90DRAFT_86568 [Jaminaea rosea]